jgi:hypothetical protein
MEIGTKYRLEREQKNNERRIEQCLKEAEILETRNEEIKKLLANA